MFSPSEYGLINPLYLGRVVAYFLPTLALLMLGCDADEGLPNADEKTLGTAPWPEDTGEATDTSTDTDHEAGTFDLRDDVGSINAVWPDSAAPRWAMEPLGSLTTTAISLQILGRARLFRTTSRQPGAIITSNCGVTSRGALS